MKRHARRPDLVLLAGTVLILLGAAAFGQTTPPEIWVAGECLGKISIIDPTTDLVTQTIDVSDPDGNLILDPPSCLAFSSDGDFAFVVQGRFVTPVEAVSRTVHGAFDIASLLGATGGLTLEGCAAAVPRLFKDATGGDVVKSHLYVSGTLGTGEVVGVVLDQTILAAVLSPGNPLVTSAVLSASASARGVSVLPLPAGAKHQRAWFSLVDGTDLVSQEVYLPQLAGSSLQLGRVHSVPLPAVGQPPDPVHPSSPLGGEFVVVPQGNLGPLANPLIGGECSPGGEPTAVSVTGFGHNSYTVAVLNAATSEFQIVDPTDCAVASPVSVGTDPVAMSTLGPLRWEKAYVANRGSDSVTAIGDDRSTTTIDLCPPAGGDCNTCPVAVATARPVCDVERVRVEKLDTDGNGMIDTYQVHWIPVGCDPGTEFEVACQCATLDEGCPCSCDCGEVNPPPECQCPGFPLMARSPSTRGLPDLPLLPPDDDIPVPENPWIVVGKTPLFQMDHDVPEGTNGDWDYKVEPD